MRPLEVIAGSRVDFDCSTSVDDLVDRRAQIPDR